jgi:hypothetical protein
MELQKHLGEIRGLHITIQVAIVKITSNKTTWKK